MSRYWIIAPYFYDSGHPEVFEQVWRFDIENGVVSIGWKELGDITNYDKEYLKNAFLNSYGEDNGGNATRAINMIWNFFHLIQTGDIVIARQGRKRIIGIGTVTRIAYYKSEWSNDAPSKFPNDHHYYLDVRWREAQPKIEFDRIAFGMQAIYEINEGQFNELIEEAKGDENQKVEKQTEFVLEKYLEDFIVSNFDTIFRGKLVLYTDPEEKVIGKQYTTEIGRIDILAQEPSTQAFVVIELKKGRESDTVVGQTLRYMGWVQENLCQDGQNVKGIIICHDSDLKLTYALKMTKNIEVKYYQVDFQLVDTPP